jgi:carboxylate-amine ligase
VQSLAAWFLHEQPFVPHEDDYMVYTYNRFQACRFGLEAVYVDPVTGRHMPLRDHLLLTLRQLAGHARSLGAGPPSRCWPRTPNWAPTTHAGCASGKARERLLAEVVRQGAQRFAARH